MRGKDERYLTPVARTAIESGLHRPALGRRDKDDGCRREVFRDDAGRKDVGKRSDHDVDGTVAQLLQRIGRVPRLQLDANARIREPVARQQRRDDALRGRDRAVDPQGAGERVEVGAPLHVVAIPDPQDVVRGTQERLARRGELHAVVRPLDELLADLCFDALDRSAER